MNRSIRRSRLLSAALSSALILTLAMPSVASADTSWRLTGKGWGHGIGMSQYGAYGYAKRGVTYDRILAHYYQGTTVKDWPATKYVKVNVDPEADYGSGGNDGFTRNTWTLRSGRVDGQLVIGGYKMPKNHWFRIKAEQVKVGDANPWAMTVWDVTANAPAESAEGEAVGPFFGALYVVISDTNANPLMQVAEPTGHYARTHIRYRGAMRIQRYADRIKLINVVPADHYLYGVVPREVPASWPAQALKAQAVAARSYAYPTDGEIYCTTRSQVYMGHSRAVDLTKPEAYEDPRANAAVDATTKKIVMYGSTPVTAYFFSSSGGHTANIEDVWYTSTPKAYYKGVPDPYEGDHSWTPVTWSGSGLATKLGVPGTSVTTVTKVDRASSGYVRSIDLRFSDGSVRTYSGATFRSKLGLRSTKFYLNPATVRIDQDDSRLKYSGSWKVPQSASFYGGTCRDSGVAGATATIIAKATGIAVVGRKGPNGGKAAIYVDGRYVKTVDLYSETVVTRSVYFSKQNMSYGRHVVKVVVLQKRNTASSSYHVWFDAVDVTGGSLLSE